METEKNQIEKGVLYLVATPIGNLDDMTMRGLKVLRECDMIAAEDTRVTAKLLSAFGITGKSIYIYEEHHKKADGQLIVEKLKAGFCCALVTDAGTPGISDPGEDIVKSCIEEGIRVIPIPGACAAVCALTVAGFSTRRFVFEGFLEGKTNAKKERLEVLLAEERTVIFYEAPHRLTETLSLMAEVFGPERRIALCREMTKLNEEVLHMTVSEALAYFSKNAPRGEFVIVVEGRTDTDRLFWQGMTIAEHVYYYTERMGLDRMASIKAVAKDRGLPKNAVYREFVEAIPHNYDGADAPPNFSSD